MTAITQTLDDTILARQPDQQGPSRHGLFHAGKFLLADMFSTFFFVGLYAVTHSVLVATALAIAAGVGHITWLKLRGSKIDAMQWMSIGLVVVFGGASLLTNDPRFVMLKPTLIYSAVGAVMLKRGWMNRYVPVIGQTWAGDVATVFGYIWAAMMFATAALNLALVFTADARTWAWFLGVFPLASKLGLFGVQYATMRIITVRRMRAAGAL